MSVISLLSDFGLKDPYVAEMKAVIFSICPDARVVDISHEIQKFNVRMGAFVLASTGPYFPEKSVHVAVVDPGVGTDRLPILVETKRSCYVGPDNGLLMLAAQKEGIVNVYHVSNSKYLLPDVSNTFHGRDIFAPVGAHLVCGVAPSEFGPVLEEYVVPDFSAPKTEGESLVGVVLHVDNFGNVISNISKTDFERAKIAEKNLLDVTVGENSLSVPFCSAYGEVEVGAALGLIGSGDFFEVSVNQGSAAEVFGAKAGDVFRVSLVM
jgi:S-adenosyl-L-methionine hydrolase (adenosine-forming)